MEVEIANFSQKGSLDCGFSLRTLLFRPTWDGRRIRCSLGLSDLWSGWRSEWRSGWALGRPHVTRFARGNGNPLFKPLFVLWGFPVESPIGRVGWAGFERLWLQLLPAACLRSCAAQPPGSDSC